MSNSSSSSGGIGFTGLLQIVFIVLKLCKVIDWSWVWVLSPTWGVLAVIFVLLAIYGFCLMMESKQERKLRELRDAINQYKNKIQ